MLTPSEEKRPVAVQAPPAVPHVVIIGGGFGGLYAARALKRSKVRITLLDRRNHHLFQPLLYQVATAALAPSNIAQPIRSLMSRQRNIEVLLAEAQSVDVAKRQVVTDAGPIDYDYLIVAAGVTHAYFGHPEWAHVAPGLKTLEDAIHMRATFLTAFEKAELETDPAPREAWLNFVIIGAGPTGVELAGTMAEMTRATLSKDFRHINPAQARVVLIEAANRVLPTYAEALSVSARKQLEKLGVEVRLNTKVTDLTPGAVHLGEDKILTHSVFWAAGVEASQLGKSLGETDRAGRVKVETDLTVPGHPEVFVIGDMAACVDGAGKTVPGVAPGAMQMAQHAVKNLQASLRNQPHQPFVYWDKGSLATIGKAHAVADVGPVKFGGLIAWLMWLFIHLYFLVGFDNRLMVFWQWTWSYFTARRGARLITHY